MSKEINVGLQSPQYDSKTTDQSEPEFAVTLELVWQLFLYNKKREICPEKKQWPNQLENVGLVGIALSPTNLQQKQYRQINCQNCIIDSNIYVQQSEIFSLLSGLSLQLLKVLHNCEDHFHFNSPNTIHTICLGQPGRRSRYLEFKELRQWKSEKGWQYLLINSNR